MTQESRGLQAQSGPDHPLRPVDAGTLILIRMGRSGPEVLMGQRHADLTFMPNRFVFPGGRVDRSDSAIRFPSNLRPSVRAQLTYRTRRRNVDALALAAIRETFEETGLLVGRKGSNIQHTKTSGIWKYFTEQGITPSLEDLEFVARAITPPGRVRRFDARFFLSESEHFMAADRESSRFLGELRNIQWLQFADALDLDLPYVTRRVLQHVQERYEAPKRQQRAIFMRWQRNKEILDYL